jgi:histone acetyltransferase (RNA polymerase elongator complex component)
MYRAGTYRPLPLGEAVDVCVTLAEMFARERIKVIRMGLQPTDMINEEGEGGGRALPSVLPAAGGFEATVKGCQ